MLASQLIYTSWKNGDSTTKGYMVYSKSTDITLSEEQEICLAMKYKAPNNLPYTPTLEEIERLFPKMFAYFKLTSGRYCIAQSSYVGQDYTNRWGNYIIHAYVLDDIGELIPSQMFGTNIFRTRLTDEELNAPSAPPSLPRVNIPCEKGILTSQEMKEFFGTSGKLNTWKMLAQGVCDAVSSGKRINLLDDLSNMRTWIIALSMVVPKEILKSVYFNTYTTENSDFFTLSCKQNASTSAYTYASNNLVTIDASRNDNSTDGVGCYINAVCDKMLNDYHSGVLCVGNVNKVVNKAVKNGQSADYNEAYKLVSIKKGVLDDVSSNQELQHLMNILANDEDEQEELSTIYDNIFRKYRNSMYTGDSLSIAIFKSLYPYVSDESKSNLLITYVAKKLDGEGDAQAIYADIQRDCPCEWNEALKYFLRPSFKEQINKNFNSAAALLFLNSYIAFHNEINESQKQGLLKDVYLWYALLVAKDDTKAVINVLNSCKAVDKELYRDVYRSVSITSRDMLGADAKRLFEYLKLSVDDGELFWGVLIDALDRFPDMESKYVSRFIELRNKMSAETDGLMRFAEANPKVGKFIDSASANAFESIPSDNFKGLIDNYTTYINSDKISEKNINQFKVIYATKIRDFLRNTKEDKRIEKAMAFYEGLYVGARSTKDKGVKKEMHPSDKVIMNVISEQVFAVNDLADIWDYFKCKQPMIADFMQSCESVGLDIHPRLMLTYEGYCFFKCGRNDGAKQVIREKYDRKSFYFLSEACKWPLLNEFLSCYMGYILTGMYTLYGDDRHTASQLVEYFLGTIVRERITTNVDKNKLVFYSKLKCELIKRPDTAENLHIYFRYFFETQSVFSDNVRDVIEKYLEKQGKRKWEKIFDKLIDNKKLKHDYENELRDYISEFNDTHKNIFKNLINRFR